MSAAQWQYSDGRVYTGEVVAAHDGTGHLDVWGNDVYRSPIWTTPKNSATQRAVWTSADGLAVATVNRQDVRDERGAMGWAYSLNFPVRTTEAGDIIGTHWTEARNEHLIYTPMNDDDPRDVLDTLASFVYAWAEALDSPYPDSENRGLFPMTCQAFAEQYAEEFAADMLPESGES